MASVKTHKEFVRKIKSFRENKRLVLPTGWDENSSPYSEGFVKEGRKVDIIFIKEGRGKTSFWFYKWGY